MYQLVIVYKIKIPLNINTNLLVLNAEGGGSNIQVEKLKILLEDLKILVYIK